jgi:hypothetical protein
MGASEGMATTLEEAAGESIRTAARRLTEIVLDNLYPAVLCSAQSFLFRLGRRVVVPTAVAYELSQLARQETKPTRRSDLERLEAHLRHFISRTRVLKQGMAYVPPREFEVLLAEAEDAVAIIASSSRDLSDHGSTVTSVMPIPPILATGDSLTVP